MFGGKSVSKANNIDQSNIAHHTMGYDNLFNGRSKARKSSKAKLSAWQQNNNHKKKGYYNK